MEKFRSGHTPKDMEVLISQVKQRLLPRGERFNQDAAARLTIENAQSQKPWKQVDPQSRKIAEGMRLSQKRAAR